MFSFVIVNRCDLMYKKDLNFWSFVYWIILPTAACMYELWIALAIIHNINYLLYFVSFEDGPQPKEQLSEKDIALAKIKAIKEEERRGPRYSTRKLQVLANLKQ